MHRLEADTIGAAPAPESGFLFDGGRLAPHPNAPFDRVWLAPGVDFKDYDAVYVRPVDTTAAGDSFNAAYLAARIFGAMPEQAAQAGHRLASAVIMSPGAVIARETMPRDILVNGGSR